MQGASMQTPEQLATSITQELYQINPSIGNDLYVIFKEFTEAFTRKDHEMFIECVDRYFQYPKSYEIRQRFGGFGFAPSPQIPQTSVAQPHAAPQQIATPPVSDTMSYNPFDDDVAPVLQPNPVVIPSHSVTSDASNPFSDDFETIHVQSPTQMSNHSHQVQPPVVHLRDSYNPFQSTVVVNTNPVQVAPAPVLPAKPVPEPVKNVGLVHAPVPRLPETTVTHVGRIPATEHVVHATPSSLSAPAGMQPRNTRYTSTALSYILIESKRDVGDNSAIPKPELSQLAFDRFSNDLTHREVQVFSFYGDPDKFIPEAEAFLNAKRPAGYMRQYDPTKVSIEAWVSSNRVAFILNAHPDLFHKPLKDAGLAIDFTRYLLDFGELFYLAVPANFIYKPPKSKRQHIQDLSFTSMEAKKLEASKEIKVESIRVDEDLNSADYAIHQNNSNRMINIRRGAENPINLQLDKKVKTLFDLCMATKKDEKKLQEMVADDWTLLVQESLRKEFITKTGGLIKNTKSGVAADSDDESMMEMSAPKAASRLNKPKNPFLTSSLKKAKSAAKPCALFDTLSSVLQEYCEDPKTSETIELSFLHAGLTVEGTTVTGCKVTSDKLGLEKCFEGDDIEVAGFWVRPGDGTGAILLANVPDCQSATLYHFTGKPSMQSSLKEIKKFKSNQTKIVFNDSKEIYCAYNTNNRAEIGNLNTVGRLDKVRDISAIYKYFNEDEEPEQIESIISLAICERNSRIYFLDQSNQLFEFALDDTKSVMVKQPEGKVGGNRDILPKKGRKYEKIGTPSAGKLIFLSNKHLIDIYDLNFDLLLSIDSNRSSEFCTFMQGSAHYILYKGSSDRLGCSVIAGMEDSIVHLFSDECDLSGRKTLADPDEAANTILDIVLRAANKFGPPASQAGFPTKVQVYLDCASTQAEPSQRHLSDSKFEMLTTYHVPEPGVINYNTTKPKPSEDLKRAIVSRISIHVASIQQYNLVPLFDGLFDMDRFAKLLRGDEKKSSVNKVIDNITFGHFETLIQNWDGPINVASIVGRQSSGKSYMLNRLFGTRFNVAAERCTDGIWMSTGYYKPTNGGRTRLIVVLDCEGLFSVARSASEEMKLCLALASLTDAFIANQDLSFNRNLSAMIESLTRGVGKLKGDKLFKGRLAFFMRDVSNNQVEFDGARREFKANMAKIVSNENSFLFKLFERKAENYTFVHFEDPDFPTLIEKAKLKLLEGMDQSRWYNGDEFLRSFKGVLAQLTVDDDLDLDEHTSKNQTENALKKVKA